MFSISYLLENTFTLFEQRSDLQARSSVGEHFLDAEGVGGSIPPVPMPQTLRTTQNLMTTK